MTPQVIDLSGGTSKVLWMIEMIWNGGQKTEIEGFYWSDMPEAVNRQAVGIWPALGLFGAEYRGCEDNVDGSSTLPGHPYVGSATLDAGASCCNIFVSAAKPSAPTANYGGLPVPLARMGVMNLKRILKSRKIPFDHKEKQPVLAALLAEYIDAPRTPGNDEKPKGPPEDALSAQTQATAEPKVVQQAEPKTAQPGAKRAKLE